jgi:hypothetical protein
MGKMRKTGKMGTMQPVIRVYAPIHLLFVEQNIK